MITLEAARLRILTALPAPGLEKVPVSAAVNRFLALDVTSPLDLPPFDNSAMDGYAVRAADVAGAVAAQPMRLRVIGRGAAGQDLPLEVRTGESIRLFTGSPLPRGADAVVMQEDTRRDPADPEAVLICGPVSSGEAVRRRGDDVRRGEVLGQRGAMITPGRLALLAATGIGEVTVGRRPTVGVLATGSELCEPGSGHALAPGQIFESNRAMLAALIEAAGGRARVYPLVPDNQPATVAALQQAFAECDLVVTSGGVSVGELDYVKPAFAQLGGDLEFWRVAMRPGKPFVFGRCSGCFLFGLPGNPVSAFVTFALLVRPALRQWQGAAETGLRVSQGILREPLTNSGDRRHFLRVQVSGAGEVTSAGRQASHALGSLAAANGLVDLAPGSVWPAGSMVPVLNWD